MAVVFVFVVVVVDFVVVVVGRLGREPGSGRVRGSERQRQAARGSDKQRQAATSSDKQRVCRGLDCTVTRRVAGNSSASRFFVSLRLQSNTLFRDAKLPKALLLFRVCFVRPRNKQTTTPSVISYAKTPPGPLPQPSKNRIEISEGALDEMPTPARRNRGLDASVASEINPGSPTIRVSSPRGVQTTVVR